MENKLCNKCDYRKKFQIGITTFILSFMFTTFLLGLIGVFILNSYNAVVFAGYLINMYFTVEGFLIYSGFIAAACLVNSLILMLLIEV